jgi:hypothetical protein
MVGSRANLCALSGAQPRSYLEIDVAGCAGFFYVSKKEFTQGGGGQTACKISIVKIVPGEISKLLSCVLVFVSGELRSRRERFGSAGIIFTVPGEKVEDLDSVGERE